jgi:hypothetical protein
MARDALLEKMAEWQEKRDGHSGAMDERFDAPVRRFLRSRNGHVIYEFTP